MIKKLKKILVTTLSILFILSIAVFFFLRRSLAPLDGTMYVKNLSGPIRVLRDEYGIPHIYAQSKTDALRALGYVMASERLFQMEMSRRMTQGTLSEVVGDVALKSDKLYRSLGLRHTMEEMLANKMKSGEFDEKMFAEMEAYCDGINQYQSTHPLPYGMTLLRIKPRPFTPIDAYIMTGHMAYSFGVALKNDILMTSLAKNLTPGLFQDLRNDKLQTPLKFADAKTEALRILEPMMIATENHFSPYFDGSNSWLIGPQRSQSGKSILANDPHIGFSHPAVWFEAHIHTPTFELYGHYLPMVPFAVLGHSRHHAWGFTMSQTDDMDLYREKVDHEKKMVMFNKQWQPYRARSETILVKDKPATSFQVIETPHGPLMDEVLEEKNIALKWAFHTKGNDPITALYKMGEAKTMKDFEEALKPVSAPGLNVMYADPRNIAWWSVGDYAVKNNPNSDLILEGSSGDDEYQRLFTWDEKPHLVNPPSGIIVTANSRPTAAPAEMRGDWQADDRYQTIIGALSEKDLWKSDDFKELQTLNYNSNTPVILEKLLKQLSLNPAEQTKYGALLEKLRKWDLHSELNSSEASLYHQWNAENMTLLLSGLNEKEREAYLNTTHAWVFYKRVLKDENSEWWQRKSQKNLITEGFKKAVTKWTTLPTWGEIHTIEYVHPLGRSFPLNLIFNLGPYPIPGAYNEINNNKQRNLGADFKVLAGASTRRIVDFAKPQTSWGINPIGISEHILSPFYKDEVHMFIKGEYRPQLMDLQDIQKNQSHDLILR
ncbi:penicillin acylase family protein [Bdellovibrio svalbardensis]|uniref:Penicillin acylase family protein n=1 Tax=Bdellovibrio svalbardensis TaxID=2972972 RepID=A0ABT6DHB1_9BACT|nr:penicillin acylase family protein [Bdellovibrio svalbardensis]MDG0816225.1 penicillin acylase family protein [Bdellovibrio svalbardensis]